MTIKRSNVRTHEVAVKIDFRGHQWSCDAAVRMSASRGGPIVRDMTGIKCHDTEGNLVLEAFEPCDLVWHDDGSEVIDALEDAAVAAYIEQTSGNDRSAELVTARQEWLS